MSEANFSLDCRNTEKFFLLVSGPILKRKSVNGTQAYFNKCAWLNIKTSTHRNDKTRCAKESRNVKMSNVTTYRKTNYLKYHTKAITKHRNSDFLGATVH